MSEFGGSNEATATPQTVTISGWLLVVGGALGALFGLGLFGVGNFFGASAVGGFVMVFGVLTLALGVGQVWVGLQILKLTAQGLRLGTMLSYASIALSLIMAFVVGFGMNTLLGLLIPGFVLWTLNQNKALFTK